MRSILFVISLASLAAAEIVTPKLLSAQKQAAVGDSVFRIDFLARPAARLETPGHAWVCIYRGPKVGPPVRDCYGFYPKTLSGIALGLVTSNDYPSVVRTDDGDAVPTKTATIGATGAISRTQYNAVGLIVAAWQAKGYNLAWQNCTDFVSAVALAVGLAAPPGAAPRYPPAYLSDLARLNPNRLSLMLPTK